MKKILLLLLILTLVLLNLSLSAQSSVELSENEQYGSILTDSAGNTLYYFTRDAGNDFSSCNGGCLNNWPIFFTEELVAGDGLIQEDFKSFQRGDGEMQSSYKGWPLYYFASDTLAGETNGEARGGVWYVAKPDYSIMLMNDSLVGADGVTYNGTYEPGSEVIQYFTDEGGRALYVFVPDSLDNNNFTNEDFSNDGFWPIYGQEELGSLPSSLDRNLFNTIDVFGRSQFTYNGWPLYYWGQDSLRGDTYGVSVPSPGVWPVAVQNIEVAPTGVNILLNEDSSLGNILVDGDGRTIYYFTRDAGNDFSACNGGCKTTWPVFNSLNLSPGDGLDSSDFTSFLRDDGELQTSYKGWPLYYFVNDTISGETNGEARGGVWYVAKPDYSIMLMNDSLVGADGITYNGMYEPGTEVIQYFTDEDGRALYVFVPDSLDNNNFTNEDFSNDGFWPIYGQNELGSIPSSLDRNLFNTIDVFGRSQFTYNGWPLYYWGQDSLRGDTYGVSVPSPGVWPVAVQNIEVAPTSENVSLSLDSTLGNILVDGDGKTLYYFTRDAGNDFSACNGGCKTTWPVFHSLNLSPGEGLAPSDFTSFLRDDGDLQTSYKGWPLYYFASDTLVGETNGEARGEVWYVAKPDYSIMLMNDSLVGADGVTYDGTYEPGSEIIQFFTDAEGRTLYTFVVDNYDVNNFTNEDFSNDPVWPIYGEDELSSIPTTLDRDLFNTIDVFGRSQFTYNGWPLYYWGPDSLRGDTYGVSVPSPGVWPVAVSDVEAALPSSILDKVSKVKINVYPNPFNDKVRIMIDSDQFKIDHLILFNSLGKKIKEMRSNEFVKNLSTIEVDNLNVLNSGIYYLHLTDKTGQILTYKLIRQN